MTAPAKVALVNPNGVPLKNGFSTRIALGFSPDAPLWIKGVTPPELDGGDAFDGTTMHNLKWRTKCIQALVTMGDMTARASWDPRFYSIANLNLNVEGAITVHFPDESTLTFYGALTKFTPDELVEGSQPEATLTITVTNVDPDTGVEEDPVWEAAP